jgi:hypothetical protein
VLESGARLATRTADKRIVYTPRPRTQRRTIVVTTDKLRRIGFPPANSDRSNLSLMRVFLDQFDELGPRMSYQSCTRVALPVHAVAGQVKYALPAAWLAAASSGAIFTPRVRHDARIGQQAFYYRRKQSGHGAATDA